MKASHSIHKSIKNIIAGFFLLLFYLPINFRFAAFAHDSTIVSELASYAGASNDPFLSLIYLPYFNLPTLNRFPFIIRGELQNTNAVFIDSIELDLGPIYSNGNNDIPYFFDGYRSWFNGAQNASVLTEPSFSSVDQGGGTGANVFVTHGQFTDNLTLKAMGSYTDAALSIESPIFSKFIHLGIDGRFGYNSKYIKSWMEPYTSNGNVNYYPSRYGDIGGTAKIDHILNSEIILNFKSTVESQTITTPAENDFSIQTKRRFIFSSAKINTNISNSLFNQFKFGYSNLDRDDNYRMFGKFNYKYNSFNLSDELSFHRYKSVQPYIGIQVKKSIGTERSTLNPTNFVPVDTPFYSNKTVISPFTRVHLQLPSNMQLDLGFRIDKYKNLDQNSGALLYLSPSIALENSASFDLTYRLRFEYPVLDFFSIVLQTGTYNQSPAIIELQNNAALPSIKSSKHALSFLSKFSGEFSIQSSLYFHYFWNIPVFPPIIYNIDERNLLQPEAESNSRGFECMINYRPSPKIDCLLGYTLSKCEEKKYLTGEMEPRSFDRRNKITGHFSYMFPMGIKASSGLIFTTGVPVTPIIGIQYAENSNITYPVYGKYNSTTGKNYVSLNSRIDYSKTFKRLELAIFVEGKDLLKTKIDEKYNYNFSSEGMVEIIDKRCVDFGLIISY